MFNLSSNKNHLILPLLKGFAAITILSLLIIPTRVLAEGQVEEVDYDKIAQKAININKNTIYFDTPKTPKQITNYIKKFQSRLSNNIMPYGLIDMDNSELEIPLNIDITSTEKNINDNFEESRKAILNRIETNKSQPETVKTTQLGENQINFDELSKEYTSESLKSKSAINQNNLKFSKIYFESNGEIIEIKKLVASKSDKNVNKNVFKKRKA